MKTKTKKEEKSCSFDCFQEFHLWADSDPGAVAAHKSEWVRAHCVLWLPDTLTNKLVKDESPWVRAAVAWGKLDDEPSTAPLQRALAGDESETVLWELARSEYLLPKVVPKILRNENATVRVLEAVAASRCMNREIAQRMWSMDEVRTDHCTRRALLFNPKTPDELRKVILTECGRTDGHEPVLIELMREGLYPEELNYIACQSSLLEVRLFAAEWLDLSDSDIEKLFDETNLPDNGSLAKDEARDEIRWALLKNNELCPDVQGRLIKQWSDL
jgi:hypothetical protein